MSRGSPRSRPPALKDFMNFSTVLFTLVICASVIIVAFLALLALPQSRLRSMLLELCGWGTASAAAVSIVSPIDPIPDFIPVLGQMDDIAALIVGLLSVAFAIYQRRSR